ncbi:AAA family ATPase [Spirulina sp. CS-785/01]|uniref:nucleotide-binding protein n=1 Tax=Spirulina sp. CS-785/01 TaxID=3021716 RepID=UPI00232F646B|nr:AAA family ATPase [Spirulina sp. CS-785/01]MDB9315606.1 AAA family ATPase [Spirulina sp. CS-785/01]
MILTLGGIKGGAGKSTLATNLVIMRSQAGKDVLLVDADVQGSSSDFSLLRNENPELTSYTAIKLHGASVRSEILKLQSKHDDILIDVGGRDTAGQRAALSISDLVIIPFLPSSFDVWTLDSVSELLDEARAFNEKLRAICILNRADPKHTSRDNTEAIAVAQDYPQLEYIPTAIVNRKAFRRATDQGLSVVELTGRDRNLKANREIQALYDIIFSSN